MRKSLLTSFCFLFSLVLSAQFSSEFKQAKLTDAAKIKAVKVQKIGLTGMEDPGHLNPNLPLNDRTEPAEAFGTTTYDLQSNNSTQNRLYNHGGNKLTGVWTMGLDAVSGWPDRGTGVNTNDGTGWGPPPTVRIEQVVRTGWPAVGALDDGTPVIVSHISDGAVPISVLHLAKWHEPSGTWIETDIPTNNAGGMLWPRMATGGPDGNSIHVIGITTPTGNGGNEYAGMNGHLLYNRSTDGGDSWDLTDIIIPGMDSTKYLNTTADSYNIDVDGENVAIAFFDDLGDVLVSKSTDNGTTWTTSIVRDFPIDKYVVDQGWTIDDLTYQDTVNSPAVNSVLSSDQTGEVLIDRDGLVHVWYGEMYYADDDLTDGSFSFFPLIGGIRYWNETHGEDSSRVVSGLLDSDGNGTFDLAGTASAALAGNYFTSATPFISAGVDLNNNIYMTHSALVENYWKEDANPTLQHYHHIYLTVSQDGGATWLDDPIDVVAPGLVDDDDLIPAMEAVYPSMARDINSEQLHLSYQLDFEPGTALGSDSDPAETNFIYHLAYDLVDLGIVGTEEIVAPETFNMNLSPNPAEGNVNVSFEFEGSKQTTIRVMNMVGQEVATFEKGNLTTGKHSYQLDLNYLSSGLYMVSLKAGDQISTKKLLIK
ncbi:MAG: T9SS type A sorting domain-containing protein [Saprospiraceae bacterium]|jgi:hypothetical protein|nr:T9SS type A sorting domain-containing protein [Saprospiraceae bacterium]